MSRFIKAELGLHHTVIYMDDEGKYFRFFGGTWTWRTHNPGNLFPASVSARHNQIGSTGHFAIFPDYENGHLALLDCLQTTYKDASIDVLVKKYAPKEDGNNVEKYTKFLREQTGVFDDKRVRDFTLDEFDKLWRAIEKIEGYQEGTILEVCPIIQVYRDKHGMYQFNVKTIGWTSKQTCIELTQQGRLDVVICTSAAGSSFLRARRGSFVNSCLEDLIVKNPDRRKRKK